MAYTGVNLGAQTTVNQLAANQMPDVDKMLFLIYPYQTPLFQKYFFAKGKSQVCINENGKFSWMEDELVPHQTTVTSITGGASSEDNITVGSHNPFNEGDVFLIEDTEELVYVDSVASDQIDITTLDGSNITACSSGYIKKVGSRNHEFDTARTAQMTKEIEKFNYCTIFSETITTSGRYQAGEKYTNGKSHAEQLQKKILEMKLTYERNFWFSTLAYSGTISTNYRFTFGEGALSRFTTNEIQYTGALTEQAWDDFLKTVFTGKGSTGELDLYLGADVIAAISKFVKDKYREASVTKEYGVDVSSYITPFGKANVRWNPIFDGKFSQYAFAVNPSKFKMRYMGDDEKGSRKFRIEENVETPGTDGKSTKILADIGAQWANEESCGFLKP